MTEDTGQVKTTGEAKNTGIPGERPTVHITGNETITSTGITITEITNTGITVGRGTVGISTAG